MAKHHVIYRHYDESGALLYLGCTTHIMKRLREHGSRSDWYDQIETITLEHFASREEAFEAEKVAIEKEQPQRNRLWTDNYIPNQVQDVGRPRKFTFNRDDLLWIGAVWSSRDYRFNRQRVQAIRVKFPSFQEQDYYKNRDAIERAKKEADQ